MTSHQRANTSACTSSTLKGKEAVQRLVVIPKLCLYEGRLPLYCLYMLMGELLDGWSSTWRYVDTLQPVSLLPVQVGVLAH